MSTDEIYGDNREGRDHMPDSPTHPQNPYSASKAGGEALARAFSESFGLPLLIVRANNNYGQYQYPDKVMGRFICQLLENEPITIHGSGAVKRSFIHVSDCCRAIYTVLKKARLKFFSTFKFFLVHFFYWSISFNYFYVASLKFYMPQKVKCK